MSNDLGRPTKFKPEYCTQLIEHMAEGLSFESFAAVLGVARSTLYYWEKIEESNFSDAHKRGTDACLLWFERASRHQIAKGKGSAAMLIFNLKNRFSDLYQDRREIVSPDGSAPISISIVERAKD